MTAIIVAALVFISSLMSLLSGMPVAIIEILAGIVAGNLGLNAENWMLYLSGLGGIVLTFLAGAEIDTEMMKKEFKGCFLIGFFAFLVPFIGVSLYTRYVAGWDVQASLVAGCALSTTSVAVVYSILVESNLSNTRIGKMLLTSTFITDIAVVIVMSVLFIKPTLYMGVFVLTSIVVIVFAVKFSHIMFDTPKLKNKVIEPEIKYLLLLLMAFMYFAELGASHAVLPAFVLGLLMSRHFSETRETKVIRNRLRTVAYAVITPIFFIVGGMKVSLSMIMSALGLFAALFAIQLITKYIGVYFFAKRFIPGGEVYVSLIMSTGLTFGIIASVFGLTSGIINQLQYSLLIGVVVASAVIPTFIAQKWFMPVHSEDII